MNKNNARHFSRREALDFLDDIDRVYSLVGILNIELDRLSAKWSHLTEMANAVYAELEAKSPRNAYRPELTD